MTVKRFVTKRVEIEAIRWEGDNLDEMVNWTNGNFRLRGAEHDGGRVVADFTAQVFDVLHDTWIGVKKGQWIVRGAKGEFYPCDDETFHWKYEEVKPITLKAGEHVMTLDEVRKMNGVEER